MISPELTAVFLVDCITGEFEITGGDRHFVEIAREWQHCGQDMIVLTPRVGKALLEAEGLRVSYRTLPFAYADRLGLIVSYLVRGISAVLILPWKLPRMLLYSTSDFLPDTLPGAIAKLLRGRSVFWVTIVHHVIPPPGERPGPFLRSWISQKAQWVSHQLIRKWADLVFVVNPLLEEELKSLGFPPERIVLTSHGSSDPASSLEEEAAYDGCFLGRLHPTKGIYDLVEIWRRVCDVCPGSRLAVIGGGPEQTVERLKGEIERHGISDEVEVLGYLPREQVDGILLSSKVFLFPSHEEGFGISVLEAMRCGLPVVAFSLSHYRKVFGESIELVPMGAIGDFAANVTALLSDEKLRSEKAKLSLEHALEFTWGKVAAAEAEQIRERLPSFRDSRT